MNAETGTVAGPRFVPLRLVVLPGLVLVGSVYAGYLIARQASAPGELQGLVYTWLVPIGLVALLLSLAGAIGRSHPSDEPRMAPTQAMAAGIALAAGTIVGVVLTPILGLTYKPAVVLGATGPAVLALSGRPDFVADPSAAATCRSVPDGTALMALDVQTAGRLRTERLLVELVRDAATSRDTITIQLGGEGGLVVIWDGDATISPSDVDAHAGTATFGDLAGANAADKGLPRASNGPSDGWPATLSGTLTWSCVDWLPNGAP